MIASMDNDLRVIIVGASGGIGSALVDAFAAFDQVARVYALSRSGQQFDGPKVKSLTLDFTDEDDLKAASEMLREIGKFDIIILATGLLHGDGISPEKNMRALDKSVLAKLFDINTIGPALTAKHFLPLLRRDKKAVFAALSARVGSISDNRLGGWYGYRASKAALNMMLKTLAIETGRRSPQTIILGLHPGTVDTNLSSPFQGNVPEGKLFTPEFCAQSLISVIDKAGPDDSGSLMDWDGQTVPF